MNDTQNPGHDPGKLPSKYELVMIAAREARRLNESARASGKELKRRVTDVAWERLQDGKIKYTYSEEPLESVAEVSAEPDQDVPDFGAEADAENAEKGEPVSEEAPVQKGA